MFKMDANQTCEILLSLVKKSNLNFSLSESPFSVSLTIKKTFIKDKNGVSRASNIGTPECSCQSDKLQFLQEEINALKAAVEYDDENLLVDKTNPKPDHIIRHKNSAKPKCNQSTNYSLPSIAQTITPLLTKNSSLHPMGKTQDNILPPKTNLNSFLSLNPNTMTMTSPSCSPTQINKISSSPYLYQKKKPPMPMTQDKKNQTSLAKTISMHDTTLPCQYQDQAIGASPRSRTPPGYPTPRTPDPTSPPDPLPFPPGTPPSFCGWTADYFGMTSEEFQNLYLIEVVNKKK